MASRRKGGFDLDRSIELTTTTPVDARQLVRTKEELLDPESFVYGFNGMITACRDEQKLYMLIDKNNPTLEASWKEIGGSIAGYDDTEVRALIAALQSGKANVADLSSVATSGDYNDLVNRPVLPAPYDDSALSGRVSALENAGFLTEHQDISGKANVADLAPVATSGSYNDLSDQPTIPEAYDDTAIQAALAGKADASSLANVATSGSYNDLGDKPTIPEAYDDSALAARVAAVETTLPNKANSADLANVATSGSYNDLGDKPTIPEAYDDTALAGRVTAIETALPGKADSSSLATVATSGSYNDLSDKPVIPPAVTVDAAMSDTSENPVQNKVVLAAIGDAIDVVEAAIADRYTKAETDGKIAEAMVDVDNEHFHPVTALPDSSAAKENHEYVLITYAQDGTTIESETHYLFYDGVFHEKQAQVSLDGYATETYVDTATGALDTRLTTAETNIAGKAYLVGESDGVTIRDNTSNNNITFGDYRQDGKISYRISGELFGDNDDPVYLVTDTYVNTATGALDTRVTAIETALNLTALTDEEIAALVPA